MLTLHLGWHRLSGVSTSFIGFPITLTKSSRKGKKGRVVLAPCFGGISPVDSSFPSGLVVKQKPSWDVEGSCSLNGSQKLKEGGEREEEGEGSRKQQG